MKSDVEIRQDVIEEILWDPQLTKIAPRIGVTVKDEVVTLTGTVDYYYQRLAAEVAAQRVAGVKVVALDINVTGSEGIEAVEDSQIASRVRDALTWHSAVDQDLVNIKVDGGFVYLEGTVDFDYERKAAERSVENLAGVKGVFNRIKIKSTDITPADIKKKITAAFQRNAFVDASNITVVVNGNIVELRGKVRSWAERSDAEKVALSMPGVTEVSNRLQISEAILAR
jgi:osmotically-inducible protein OsmY